MAFKYLSWALFPLLVCYAIYSVIYQEHRGWYSWVLSMAYGFLLTFGKSRVCLVCDNRFTCYHAKSQVCLVCDNRFTCYHAKSQVCLVCDNRFTCYHASFGDNICVTQFCETRMLLPKYKVKGKFLYFVVAGFIMMTPLDGLCCCCMLHHDDTLR